MQYRIVYFRRAQRWPFIVEDHLSAVLDVVEREHQVARGGGHLHKLAKGLGDDGVGGLLGKVQVAAVAMARVLAHPLLGERRELGHGEQVGQMLLRTGRRTQGRVHLHELLERLLLGLRRGMHDGVAFLLVLHREHGADAVGAVAVGGHVLLLIRGRQPAAHMLMPKSVRNVYRSYGYSLYKTNKQP